MNRNRRNEPHFRRDIQGLRAVAVLAVVLYHFDLGLPGGFLGVDIFFVISGFVVSQLLMREFTAKGTIDIRSFFRKRFLRLAPALAVMVATTAVVSFFLLAPSPRQSEATWTALSSILGVSNFAIERLSGGYFGSAPNTNILVHTWSLSVEWQFYVFLPLSLVFAIFLGKRLVRDVPQVFITLILMVSIISFSSTFLPQLLGNTGPVGVLFGFYSPISRAWEFGIGIIVFLISDKLRDRKALGATSTFTGFAIMLLGLLVGNESGFTPGSGALLAVIGTGLLILGGVAREETRRNLVTRLLESRPIFEVGERSYSIYLWHWPIAFLLSELTGIGFWGAAVIIFSGVILIAFSYRFLETPFRRRESREPKRLTSYLSIAFGLPLVALLAAIPLLDSLNSVGAKFGAWTTIHQGDTGHNRFHEYVEQTFYPCTPESLRDYAPRWGSFLRCQQSKEAGDVDFAIIGDSHAEHLFVGLAESLPESNVAYYILGELPIMDAGPDMKRIIEHIATDDEIHTVLMTAFWAGRGLPEVEVEEVAREFANSGKTVVLTNDVPSFPIEPWKCQSRLRSTLANSETLDLCVASPDFETQEAINASLSKIASNVERTHFIDTFSEFCEDELCSMSDPQSGLLYRDPHHLNLGGTRFIGEKLSSAIRPVLVAE